ncbi:Nucleoside diphosphate kinase [Streptomyces purpurascens]
MTQRTLVLLKPDAVRRGLTGEIIGRIERKAGWRITALELRTLDEDTLEQHYGEHKGKPFYEPLVEFMASGPVVALIVEGERVIEGLRALAGPTDPTGRPAVRARRARRRGLPCRPVRRRPDPHALCHAVRTASPSSTSSVSSSTSRRRTRATRCSRPNPSPPPGRR